MSEVKDLAAKQLQLQSHVDSIQEAIDVMLLLVPEEEGLDSRILRAMSGLEHTKRYWLEFIGQSEHGEEFRKYCESKGLAADNQTAQQFFDKVLHEEEQVHEMEM